MKSKLPKQNLKILKLGGRAAQNTGRSGYRHNDAMRERCEEVRGREEILGGGLDAPSKQRRSETETDARRQCLFLCSPLSAAFWEGESCNSRKNPSAMRGKIATKEYREVQELEIQSLCICCLDIHIPFFSTIADLDPVGTI